MRFSQLHRKIAGVISVAGLFGPCELDNDTLLRWRNFIQSMVQDFT
jgi:hypothetical protein